MRTGLTIVLLLGMAMLAMPRSAIAADESMACDPEPTDMLIQYGDVLSGAGCTINPGTDLDVFRFAGSPNDVIRIVARRVGGTAGSSCIELFGPDQKSIAKQCGSVQMDQSLTLPGTHTVVVSESIGLAINYELSLTLIFSDQALDVPLNSSVAGQIIPGVDVDLFRFTAQSGDVIRIVARRVGGTAGSACVELIGPDRSPVEAQCGSVQIDETLQQTGIYTLVVSESIRLSINFEFSLSLISSDQAPNVQLGRSATGQINPGVDVDVLRFYGTANDVVRIVASRVGGTAGNVCVELLGPAFNLIDMQCGSVQINKTLTTTGFHVLVISESLRITISYTLSLTCLFGVCSPPVFTDSPLVPGQTPIRAIHTTELRSRIDGLRLRQGLSAPFGWTTRRIVPTNTDVKGADAADLRSALEEVFVARSQSPPTYTDPTVVPTQTQIRATHFNELRAAVLLLEAQ